MKQSCAMIEEAENLKTLVVENKELRQELDKLKADHEKSIAQVLESSSMATDERDRKIAAQEQKSRTLTMSCAERGTFPRRYRLNSRVFGKRRSKLTMSFSVRSICLIFPLSSTSLNVGFS